MISQHVLSAGDVAEVLFRGAARLGLPLGSLAVRISGEDYDLQEPPEAASEWIDMLTGLLGGLQERLQAAPNLPERAVVQVRFTPLLYPGCLHAGRSAACMA